MSTLWFMIAYIAAHATTEQLAKDQLEVWAVWPHGAARDRLRKHQLSYADRFMDDWAFALSRLNAKDGW